MKCFSLLWAQFDSSQIFFSFMLVILAAAGSERGRLYPHTQLTKLNSVLQKAS